MTRYSNNPTEIDWDQYTTNQYDLRKAWESEGSGESASDWGKRHYNTSGKAEGRQTDWISDDEGADWEGYTKSNKDLNAHWQSQGGDQTAAEFGESHWYSHGKEEGRTLNQQQAQDFKDKKTQEVQNAIKDGGGNVQGQWGDNYDGQDLWGLAKSGEPGAMKALHGRIKTNKDTGGEITRDTFNQIAGRELSYEDAKTAGWKGDQSSWDSGSMKGDDIKFSTGQEAFENIPPPAPDNKREENPRILSTSANRGEPVKYSERDAVRNRDGRISIDFPWQGPKWREGSGGNYEMPKQETSYKYQEYLDNSDPSSNSNKESTNSNNIHNKLKEMQSKMTEKYGFTRPDESTQDWSRYR